MISVFQRDTGFNPLRNRILIKQSKWEDSTDTSHRACHDVER